MQFNVFIKPSAEPNFVPAMPRRENDGGKTYIFINKTFGLFIGSGRMRRPLFHLRFGRSGKIRLDRSIHFRLALSLHPEKFVSL